MFGNVFRIIDGQQYAWSVDKLIEISKKKASFPYDLSLLVHNLEQPLWTDDVTLGDIKPIDVINNHAISPKHWMKIQGVDLVYPILVLKINNSPLDVIDGLHRLAKAYVKKDEKIMAVVLSLQDIESARVTEIVHISGASGSGKTTVGNKLRDQGLTVYDTDDLMKDFYKSMEKDSDIYSQPNELFKKAFAQRWQRFLDNFTSNLPKDKVIIIVGLNAFVNQEQFVWKGMKIGRIEGAENKLFDLKPIHKFYIALNDDAVIQQRFNRGFDIIVRNFKNSSDSSIAKLQANVDVALADMNSKFKEYTAEQFSDMPKWKEQTQNQNDFFRKQGYVFYNVSDIYKRCLAIAGIEESKK